ncbi:MAG: site-specific integrase [Planctomycetes bacterium]|nr:site-specific integrase [Planctomycetota bacterium]
MTQNGKVRIPKYRLHKPSHKAIVMLDGRAIYLGEWESEESKAEYRRVVAEWLSNRRRFPDTSARDAPPEHTVNSLILAYWRYAKTYYQKNGEPTSELSCIKQALRHLRQTYGHKPASEFGPKSLKAVREMMIRADLCRKVVNDHTGRIKRMFRWATEEEMIPPSLYHGLTAVRGLRRGRSEARESEPVHPVPETHVQAIQPYVSRQIWALVQLQWLTGMRAGEAVTMQPRNLDMSGKLWLYRPSSHKTEHYGHERMIELGPKAQGIIKEFLKPDLGAFLFSPADATEERNAERRRNRKTPMTPSQARRKRKACPKKQPGDHYTTATYGRRIALACEKAGVPRWTTHQLRHSFATRIRKEHGIESARILLGHKTLSVTEVYAEVNRAAVADIVAQSG